MVVYRVYDTVDCHVLIQTAALITSPCPVLKHEHLLLLIGRGSYCVAHSEPQYLHPYSQNRAVYEHWSFFQRHTEGTAIGP